MAKYLFLYRNALKPGSPKELQAQMEKWGEWFKRLRAEGHEGGGDALGPEGVVVSAKGRIAIDGPFIEAKDLIGGYTPIDVPDLEAAIKVAKTCPGLEVGGSVEIRPIVDTSEYE